MHKLRLQCTVVRRVTTVWRGNALRDCQYNEIVLRHNSFGDRSPVGVGNNGGIVGHGVRRSGKYFTSELIISNLCVNSTLSVSGNTILCAIDNGIQVILIDIYTFTHPFKLPIGIHIYTASIISVYYTFKGKM